jgi:hypothetical protein
MKNKKILLFLLTPLYLFGFENQKQETWTNTIKESNINKTINSFIDFELGIKLSNKSFHTENILYNNSEITLPDQKYKFKLIPTFKIISKKIYIPNLEFEYYTLNTNEETSNLMKFNGVAFDDTTQGNTTIDSENSFMKLHLNFKVYKNKYFEYYPGIKFIKDDFKVVVENKSKLLKTIGIRNRNHYLLSNKILFKTLEYKNIKYFLSYEYDYSSDYRIHELDFGFKYKDIKIGSLITNDRLEENEYQKGFSMDRTNIDLSLYVNYIF